ncbi:MAG TPA: hypothetical protein VK304_03200 [Thermoleophilaceae bacterium]|nr:hypothetical protein [Thermoleophilaceae bacterium]
MNAMDIVLFFHVLSAFALVAGVVTFGAVMRQASRPDGAAALRLTPLARRLWDIGGGGTLVLGIVLALDEFEITDGWILGALALWVVAAGGGVRLGQVLGGAEGARDSGVLGGQAWGLFSVAALATLGILYLMVFKPGL